MKRSEARGLLARNAEEATRRMEIVDRYAAIMLPTAEDDARFAAELGLSVDSLLRLTRIVRLTREAHVESDEGGIALVAASQPPADPDLSRISPSRRPLVLRRLSAIRAYLAVDEPSREDVLAGAAAVGVAPASFARMVRYWTTSGDVTAIPGAREPLRKDHRKQTGASRMAGGHVAAALSTMGIRVSSLALHREVARLCELDGISPPAKSTVYHRLMRARAEAGVAVDALHGFALDHCALSLAVRGPDGVQMPVISFLFDRSTGRIVLHRLSLGAPTPAIASEVMGEGLRLLPIGAPQVRLQFGVPMGLGWDGLLSVLRRHDVIAKPKPFGRLGAGSLAGEDFGDVVGTLRLRPRHTAAPRAASLAQVMGREAPLTLDEAKAAVADAVTLHNRGRRAPIETFASATERSALLCALAASAERADPS